MSKVRWRLLTVLLMIVCTGCSDGPFVERIVIENPTEFPISVRVAGEERDGWIDLAVIDARSEKVVGQVYEQGSTWVFRFGYAGYEEELRLARMDLEKAGWHVVVPDGLATELRSGGVLPFPDNRKEDR